MHRETEVPEAEALVVECHDGLARITSKELAPIHSVKNGIRQNACSTSPRMDADFGKSAHSHIVRLMNSRRKGLKRMMTKFAVAILKNTRQLGCVFQDMELPKSSSILRKSSNILKPIRCVRFTEAVLRHADIRGQNPSFGMICPGDPHQRNPNAPKFEDWSQDETVWQERCAREAAWRLAKSTLQLKEKQTAFFSPSENRCLLASTLKPQEREVVVDSGASMHMISKKDLNSAELETVTTSRSPTTVITANGEVQTNEEATVYVKELRIFLAMKVFEDSPAVLSLGKSCDEHGHSYKWVNGQKPHLIKDDIPIQYNTKNIVPIEFPGLSTSSSSFTTSPPMTPSRQGVDHPASSSSSSTSPTMTSSTVSSESGTRRAREDLCGIDSYPVFVSSEHVEKKERGDPLTKPTKNTKPNKNEDHDLERCNPLDSDTPEWLQRESCG